MIYAQRYRGHTFIYDPNGTNIFEKLSVKTDNPGMSDMMFTMLNAGQFFDQESSKLLKIEDEPEKFFLNYIPRVFGFSAPVDKYDKVEDLP